MFTKQAEKVKMGERGVSSAKSECDALSAKWLRSRSENARPTDRETDCICVDRMRCACMDGDKGVNCTGARSAYAQE